jgi:hypothetical protein
MKQILWMILFMGCIIPLTAAANTSASLDDIAQRYVKLVLQLGQYSPDLVDSYSGPADWKTAAENAKKPMFPYAECKAEAADLLHQLRTLTSAGGRGIELNRWKYLNVQISAMAGLIELLNGKRLSFDDESRAIYACQAPHYSDAFFKDTLKQLNAALPGKGNLQKRLQAYREQFRIPKDKVAAVFAAAIDECRTRSLRFVTLPAHENFKTEFVTGKSWGAYNWYKGNAFSLIQVNLDMPQYINGPLALASHEGYPGHHVYNVLLEQHLLKGKNWIEHSVYALFSPQSLIAEGTAETAVDIIFSPTEKLEFTRDVLFPLAGLDPAKSQEYSDIIALTEKLNYAAVEAARRFLDGRITREQAVQWLVKYSLIPRERAEKKLAFITQYRTYIINYTLGKDLVEAYLAAPSAPNAAPASRQERFLQLLVRPLVPADLHHP